MSERSEALQGAAAIMEMLDLIGTDDVTDHDVAKVLTDKEIAIRRLLTFALVELSA